MYHTSGRKSLHEAKLSTKSDLIDSRLIKAWWTPNQPEPQLLRYPSVAVIESPRTSATLRHPNTTQRHGFAPTQVVHSLWHRLDGSEAPEDLTIHRRFLKIRLPDIPWFKQGFDTVSDLVSNLLAFRETGQITAALRSLWKGIVCLQCGKCIPRFH